MINFEIFLVVKSEKILSEVRVPFPKDGFTFIDTASDVGMKLFMIDPCIIWRLLSLKEQNRLQDRDSVPEFSLNCKVSKKINETIYSFGIFASDVSTLTVS